MPQGKQEGFNPNFKESFNAAFAGMSIVAVAFLPLFRRGQGREGIGMRGLFALILMLAIGGLARAPEMFVYAAFWIVVVAYRRMQSMRMVGKGAVIHSRSWGGTICPMRFPGLTREMTGRVFEVVTCLVAAFAVGPTYPVLGYFFASGALSIAFVCAVFDEADRRKVQAMEDARIEQAWYASQVHDRGRG